MYNLDAAIDHFDRVLPDWQEREQFGERFLSEWDFSPADEAVDAVSDADWDAFFEMTWSDRQEW